MSDTKRCCACKVDLPVDQFGNHKTATDGLHPRCRPCQNKQNREYKARLREQGKYRIRKSDENLRLRYGITTEQYVEMFTRQGGSCAICRKPSGTRKLAVDHDHLCCAGPKACGKCVRGLLCFRCNSMLGLVNDQPDVLKAAMSYLAATKT